MLKNMITSKVTWTPRWHNNKGHWHNAVSENYSWMMLILLWNVIWVVSSIELWSVVLCFVFVPLCVCYCKTCTYSFTDKSVQIVEIRTIYWKCQIQYRDTDKLIELSQEVMMVIIVLSAVLWDIVTILYLNFYLSCMQIAAIITTTVVLT